MAVGVFASLRLQFLRHCAGSVRRAGNGVNLVRNEALRLVPALEHGVFIHNAKADFGKAHLPGGVAHGVYERPPIPPMLKLRAHREARDDPFILIGRDCNEAG